MRLVYLVSILAACAAPARPRALTGAIAGLARDHDTGDPIAQAEIRVHASPAGEPRVTASSDRGLYGIAHLAPGRYDLTAVFAGQPVDVRNIAVRAGETTMVDVVFTLGHPEPIRIDYGR